MVFFKILISSVGQEALSEKVSYYILSLAFTH